MTLKKDAARDGRDQVLRWMEDAQLKKTKEKEERKRRSDRRESDGSPAVLVRALLVHAILRQKDQ